MAIKPEVLEKYKNLKWEELLKKNLGDLGKLDEIEPNLKRIKDVFEKLLNYQTIIEQVPSYERTLENSISTFVDGVTSEIISNYSDVNHKTAKLGYIRSQEENVISQLSPVLNYLQFVDPINSSKQQALDLKSKELEGKLEQINLLMEKVQKASEVSSVIAEGQEVRLYGNEFERMAEGEKSTEKFLKFFSKYNFRGNKQKANRSQFLMMLMLIAALFLACFFVFGAKIELQGTGSTVARVWNTLLEQNILLKIFLITALGYLVAHFSRNYSAEMNMYYINKHRQLALNSHQRILDSVRKTESLNEAETKNAILIQVSKTMFDIQETGYLSNGNSPVPTTQIIETVRTGMKNN